MTTTVLSSPLVVSVPPPVISVNPEDHPGQKHVKTFKNLGITQVVIGILCVVLTIVAVCLESAQYFPTFVVTVVGSGIWTGVMAFIAGILGIVCRNTVTTCKITGAMIVTIFAAISAGIMVCIETPLAVVRPGIVVHAILSILGFVELIIAIVHSAYCCSSGCCATTQGRVLPPNQTLVTTTTYPNQMPVTNIPGNICIQPNQGYAMGHVVATQPQYAQQEWQQKSAFSPQQFQPPPQADASATSHGSDQLPQYSGTTSYGNDQPPEYTEKTAMQ